MGPRGDPGKGLVWLSVPDYGRTTPEVLGQCHETDDRED